MNLTEWTIIPCPFCHDSFAVAQIGRHLEERHIGVSESHWICSDGCLYKSVSVSDMGAHCLVSGHAGNLIRRVHSDHAVAHLLGVLQASLSISLSTREPPPDSYLRDSDTEQLPHPTTVNYGDEITELDPDPVDYGRMKTTERRRDESRTEPFPNPQSMDYRDEIVPAFSNSQPFDYGSLDSKRRRKAHTSPRHRYSRGGSCSPTPDTGDSDILTVEDSPFTETELQKGSPDIQEEHNVSAEDTCSEKLESEASERPRKNTAPRWNCSKCARSFGFFGACSAVEHVGSRRHGWADEPIWSCRLCLQSFTSFREQRRHAGDAHGLQKAVDIWAETRLSRDRLAVFAEARSAFRAHPDLLPKILAFLSALPEDTH